ncbi:hypothetical protein EFR93_07030 [Lentilactobacillus buchneri]|nr:hypothetical protein [Lentilactobacillus buchneri]
MVSKYLKQQTMYDALIWTLLAVIPAVRLAPTRSPRPLVPAKKREVLAGFSLFSAFLTNQPLFINQINILIN